MSMRLSVVSAAAEAMARVSIVDLDRAARVESPQALVGDAATRALFAGDNDPLHVHLHRIERDGRLRIASAQSDCVAYVWQGCVEACSEPLSSGSSLIVERGASVDIKGHDAGSLLVSFAASRPAPSPRAGGHVHLLPKERVPRLADLGGASGVGGALHADASCSTCEVWLHANTFPPQCEDTSVDADRAVHSHSEDEVIFVTEGQIRLGARLYGPGTAIAIAADTQYGFSSGPAGLCFINFRAAQPREVRFRGGGVMDEVAYWKARLPSPRYISFAVV
jgi:hypothetical protein